MSIDLQPEFIAKNAGAVVTVEVFDAVENDHPTFGGGDVRYHLILLVDLIIFHVYSFCNLPFYALGLY